MQLQDAAGMAVAFVVFVIIVGVGGAVLASLQGTQFTVVTNNTLANCQANPAWANCSTVASNASAAGLTGIANLGSQSSTIGTVLGAAVIIAIVIGAFYFASKR